MPWLNLFLDGVQNQATDAVTRRGCVSLDAGQSGLVPAPING